MKNLLRMIDAIYDKFAHKLLSGGRSSESLLIRMRAMLILWTCTTIVMWLYVFYCFFVFGANYPVPWGGLFFTIIHSCVPLVYYYSQSITTSGLVLSLSGLSFQTLFCIYTGGIYSPAAIWLTFHPVILGFFGNIPLIAFQVILNFFIVVGLYFLGKLGLLPPNILPAFFNDMMIISCYVGLDVLVAVFTVVAIRINNARNKELSNSRELTENLLRILCHDINNPLSIITSSSKNLNSESLKNNPVQAERIRRASHNIQQLTASIGSWMACRDGKMILNLTKISVKEILEHINFSFDEIFKEKEISFNGHQSSENLAILGDRTAVLFQIFSNIISNAVKFSFEKSSIEIYFREEGQHIVVTVEDQGVGIEENLIDKIFSPYDSTTRKGTGGERGTGFGLPIVATVLGRMNGTISIRNRSSLNVGDKGTIVTIHMPKA